MLNYFKSLILFSAMLFSSMALAEKIALPDFCQALAGSWQGEASRPKGQVKAVQVQGLCSGDRRQLTDRKSVV